MGYVDVLTSFSGLGQFHPGIDCAQFGHLFFMFKSVDASVITGASSSPLTREIKFTLTHHSVLKCNASKIGSLPFLPLLHQ